MFNLNKADQEIISILKETFLKSRNQFVTEDDKAMRIVLWGLLFTTLLAIALRFFIFLSGKEGVIGIPIVSAPATLFFGFLFIHINNKSENMSVLVFLLTWLSIVLGLVT